MAHVRTEIRIAALAALQISLPDVTWVKDHWKTVSDNQLPRGGVGAPRTRNQNIDVQYCERSIDLLVVVKFTGDANLEDLADIKIQEIESVILPVLAGFSDDYALVEEQFDGDAGGSGSIGSVSLLFQVAPKTPINNPEIY